MAFCTCWLKCNEIEFNVLLFKSNYAAFILFFNGKSISTYAYP